MKKLQDTNGFRKKEFYKEKIIELVEKIENPKILRCIYIFVSDIMEEIKADSGKEKR